MSYPYKHDPVTGAVKHEDSTTHFVPLNERRVARQWWDETEAQPGSMAHRARTDPELKAKILENLIEANHDLAAMEFWHGHGDATIGSTK